MFKKANRLPFLSMILNRLSLNWNRLMSIVATNYVIDFKVFQEIERQTFRSQIKSDFSFR